MIKRFLFAVSCASLVSCGSSSNGGSVSGSVHGMSISIQDSISSGVAIVSNGVTQHGAVIILATSSGICTDASGDIEHPSEKGMEIELFDVNGTTLNTPTAAGAYTIYQQSGTPPAKAASLSVFIDDTTCKAITADGATATSGTVNLTDVSGNKFGGNYDVALDSGDHITGDFSPEECPGLQTAISAGSASPSCQ